MAGRRWGYLAPDSRAREEPIIETVDAVVIGSGPNGLVAANILADAGWDVLVLEAQPTIGGAVSSDGSVADGYVHDTFSSFYPLAAASPTIQSFDLHHHGLHWVHGPSVLGSPYDDGSWAVLHRDRDDTAAGLEEDCPGDGEAWLELCRTWDRIGDHVIGALLSPFPPVREGTLAFGAVMRSGGMALVRQLLAPVLTVGRQQFRGDKATSFLVGNAGHADIPMDAAGSGLMGVLMAMLAQHHGFPVPEGGAGNLAGSLARRLETRGGVIRTGQRVSRVTVTAGRATGVVTDGGESFGARKAVVADVTAPSLYGGLLPWDELPERVRAGMRTFEWDPGTVKVDWALDGPVPWTNAPARAPGTVHVAERPHDISTATTAVASGRLPSSPFLLVGQMAASDPTRAPAGAESLWAYTHVPHDLQHDEDGEVRGTWDRDDCERYADRMQRMIERYAPSFAERIVARRVLGPHEMQARDENLTLGSINGGTSSIHQQLVFRPIPGNVRPETFVKGLYLGSASAHPGGGVHGAPGSNAARAALAHARVRRFWPGR
jgi:phytoene dehydrogenase-like protein